MVNLVQNNDYVFKFTVVDQDGTAINLTSCQIFWTLKRSSSSTAVVSKSTSSGVSITSAAGGIFEVTITSDDIEDVEGDYYSEALIVDSTGKETTVTPENISPQVVNFRKKFTFSGA